MLQNALLYGWGIIFNAINWIRLVAVLSQAHPK